MRDKLIHGYFGVDLDAVWDTAIKDIPALKKEVEQTQIEAVYTLYCLTPG